MRRADQHARTFLRRAAAKCGEKPFDWERDEEVSFAFVRPIQSRIPCNTNGAESSVVKNTSIQRCVLWSRLHAAIVQITV